MNTELRRKLYDMFLSYNYEESKELLRSVFTTIVIMEDLDDIEIAKLSNELYTDAEVGCLDISYKDFYDYMTDILIQI